MRVDRLIADYGFDVTTSEGRRSYERAIRPARDRKIKSAAQYVGICRAIAPHVAGGIDGRLVACGWNRVPPRAWVNGEMVRFLEYWARAADRPGVVGSSYNPDPDHVARAWSADIPAALVRSGLRLTDREGRARPMPRERVRRLLSAARAARRTSVGRRNVSTRALWRLGQFCPELQRAALAALPDEHTDKPLRIRDLDWAAVARLQRNLAADTTGRIRAAWAAGKRQATLVEAARPGDRGAWLCPSYPDVPLPIAARLTRGETPVSIASSIDPDARLTRAEAHAWALAGAQECVLVWWCEHESLPTVRSWPAARWLRAVRDRGDWHVLTRERRIHGPAGAEAIVRYLDRVDEIQDCDLVRGSRTGVDAAFEHAAERCGETWMAKAREDHRVLAGLPTGWRLYQRCMRHLATPAQLVREGDEMEHCVGGYAPAVESGRSVILSIRVLDTKSTVELDRGGRVLQHHGPRNEQPGILAQRVLARAARRNGWTLPSPASP
jgi:hypothetical protein